MIRITASAPAGMRWRLSLRELFVYIGLVSVVLCGLRLAGMLASWHSLLAFGIYLNLALAIVRGPIGWKVFALAFVIGSAAELFTTLYLAFFGFRLGNTALVFPVSFAFGHLRLISHGTPRIEEAWLLLFICPLFSGLFYGLVATLLWRLRQRPSFRRFTWSALALLPFPVAALLLPGILGWRSFWSELYLDIGPWMSAVLFFPFVVPFLGLPGGFARGARSSTPAGPR